MGQTIQVQSSVNGDVAVFDTDRTLTGQDAEAFSAPAEGTVAADLASRLFAADPAIDHVFVQFNLVSARRQGGWDEASLQRAATIVERLFEVYPADS